MYGRHAAAKSGLAVLLAGGLGTDNISAIDLAEEFYHARPEKEVVGESIAATEHSVVCANGAEDEYSTILRLLTEVYPSGNFSYVSDTWDFWKVVTEYLPRLKDVIINRDGKFVVRPDSGNPYDILCGAEVFDDQTDSDDVWEFIFDAEDGDLFRYKGEVFEVWGLQDCKNEYGSDSFFDAVGHTLKDLHGSGYWRKPKTPLNEVEEKGLIQILYEIFGGSETHKGYKVLDQHIGTIYGEGIAYPLAERILNRLAEKGFASCNVVFGLGSYLFQHVTRDTHGIAMKATSVTVNGERSSIQKTPKTDKGTKKSAKGYLKVDRVDDKLTLFEDVSEAEEKEGLLETVFCNGRWSPNVTLEDVRGRVQLNYATRFVDGELRVNW
jgi:nicotinamide phosphoribosyltransferase